MALRLKPAPSPALVAAVVQRAAEWREAEIYECETDSVKEREERQCVTYAALCKLRKAVNDLLPHLKTD